MSQLDEYHDVWCPLNGCRCGTCGPCAGFAGCSGRAMKCDFCDGTAVVSAVGDLFNGSLLCERHMGLCGE